MSGVRQGAGLLSGYTLPQKEVDGQVETNFETDNTLSKLNGDTKEQKTEESQSEPELLSEGSYFEIHFIDVGQADAELIICDDHAHRALADTDGANQNEQNAKSYAFQNHL